MEKNEDQDKFKSNHSTDINPKHENNFNTVIEHRKAMQNNIKVENNRNLPTQNYTDIPTRSNIDITYDSWNVIVGRSMAKLRKKKNIGQSEAALEANFSPSYLCNVENGKHSVAFNKVMTLCYAIQSDSNEFWSIFHEEMGKENIYNYLLNDIKGSDAVDCQPANDSHALRLSFENYMHKHCQECPVGQNYFKSQQNEDENSSL